MGKISSDMIDKENMEKVEKVEEEEEQKEEEERKENPIQELECDYLVVGAGACAMAFVDELIMNTSDTKFIMVDKHRHPGGHWNDAYDFVTLHQPAEYYGVNSKPLEKRYNSLATCAEIREYYEEVMRGFQDGGRVRFLPQCEYKWNSSVQSLLDTDVSYRIKVNKKVVDATYTGSRVPSTCPPQYQVGSGVHLVPVNELSRVQRPWQRYVVIGGGKTGIDAVLFLLNSSVSPKRIVWIVPNDYWLINRCATFTDVLASYFIKVMDCILHADDADDLFLRFEKAGWVFRIDKNTKPTAIKGGNATEAEVEQLRTVKENIIRKGRIKKIDENRIVFNSGEEMDTNSETLHVDCSANGLPSFDVKPIFEGRKITLQGLRLLQDLYSASVIAEMERRFPDNEDLKNTLKPLQHPQNTNDYLTYFRDGLINEMKIGQHLGMWWVRSKRLNYEHHMPLYSYIRYLIYARKFGTTVFDKLNSIVEKLGNK